MIIIYYYSLKYCVALYKLLRPRIKSARNFQHKPLRNQGCLSRADTKNHWTLCGEFLDFRLVLKISAFLFAALIFFVSFFYQEKKENRVYENRLSAIRNAKKSIIINSFTLFNLLVSPPQPAGLRNWNAAAFASFNISTSLNAMLCIFLNTDFVGTEPKPVCRMQSGREAAYPVTVLNSNHNSGS